MRIIGGQLKRRKLRPPPAGVDARPITDRVRESLFNLLRGHFEGATVLDVFAGTGTIGLEAISRGAQQVIFFERDRKTARVLEQNLEELGVRDRGEVFSGDALGPQALGRVPGPVHIIFFDPPYAMVRDPESWPRVQRQFERMIQLLDDTGFAVLRTPRPFLHIIERQVASEYPLGDEADSADADEPVVITLDADDLEDDHDADAAAFDEFERALVSGGKEIERLGVPLEMDGAEGPETHAYGNMALHLYMKSKG